MLWPISRQDLREFVEWARVLIAVAAAASVVQFTWGLRWQWQYSEAVAMMSVFLTHLCEALAVAQPEKYPRVEGRLYTASGVFRKDRRDPLLSSPFLVLRRIWWRQELNERSKPWRSNSKGKEGDGENFIMKRFNQLMTIWIWLNDRCIMINQKCYL